MFLIDYKPVFAGNEPLLHPAEVDRMNSTLKILIGTKGSVRCEFSFLHRILGYMRQNKLLQVYVTVDIYSFMMNVNDPKLAEERIIPGMMHTVLAFALPAPISNRRVARSACKASPAVPFF